MENLWEKAKMLSIQTGNDIVGGFDVGFDEKIEEEMKDALMNFVYWVEDHYFLPITLWVDFKYKYDFVEPDKKRTGYRFYWVDYKSLEYFDNFDDIPVIELAVRNGNRTMDEILSSFIDAITHYFAWLSGQNMHSFQPEKALTEAILSIYKNT